MNGNTKEALKRACEALQELAARCYQMAGHDTVTDVVVKLEELKVKLDKDETILE